MEGRVGWRRDRTDLIRYGASVATLKLPPIMVHFHRTRHLFSLLPEPTSGVSVSCMVLLPVLDHFRVSVARQVPYQPPAVMMMMMLCLQVIPRDGRPRSSSFCTSRWYMVHGKDAVNMYGHGPTVLRTCRRKNSGSGTNWTEIVK